MASAAGKMMKFFSHESCGKCTPCREGTYWLRRRYEALLDGRAEEKDIPIMDDVAGNMTGTTLCALGDFAVNPVRATIKHFPRITGLDQAGRSRRQEGREESPPP